MGRAADQDQARGQGGAAVRRRHVFYIPGYDPIHPRRYRELYRSESAAQAGISGYEIAQRPKQTGGPYGWHVTAHVEGAAVEADVEVLVWSDIVRDSMAASIPATYLQLLRTAWIYISTGALFRLMRLRKGPVIAALYPVGMLLLQLLLALGVGALLGFAAGGLAEWGFVPFLGAKALSIVGLLLYLGTFCAVSLLLLRWFKARDGTFFAYYLMHDYAYSAAARGANPPELEARITAFRQLISSAMEENAVDEVLLVGHSSGAHVGVSVLADLLREGLPETRPALGFLSLGQVVPMVSFLPEADRLRGDLRYLSASADITWVDVSAPGDGCAFALCDPVAVSGVAPSGKRWPLVISAAFTQTLSPARWKELRWRFFRLHFQYLCAFDQPGDYDYFKITAGPMTLADRYAGRQPSKSRIEAARSGYTSVRAP
ncbi:hypothetical protein PXK01_10890 [Phaeobacter sp. PT47_59]|uniref:hypothetical protein n=1 Tax=Phaeobacter sp. PT47_59 TaxID=3029979 RepID=UPI0023806096|nr:hypothetical protein [Phaeobacter sp. PT47_59]MDE4174662.1 hypothetical protein [Phaeobacter sp. PT47_59]